jgi:hypothetical protein
MDAGQTFRSKYSRTEALGDVDLLLITCMPGYLPELV